MDKTKTSHRQEKSSESTQELELRFDSGLISYSPTEELLDESFISKAVWDCLKNNDPEGVIEVIQAHLAAVNKQQSAKEAQLPRSTLYNTFKGKNPTIRTLAKLISCVESARNSKLVKRLTGGEETAQTISVPLLGNIACGGPLLAEENIERYIDVSVKLACGPHEYYILRAVGDSMNKAGICDGDLVLIRNQSVAENGQIVVALIDSEATLKTLKLSKNSIILEPASNNPAHRPVVLERDFQIQGVLVQTL